MTFNEVRHLYETKTYDDLLYEAKKNYRIARKELSSDYGYDRVQAESVISSFIFTAMDVNGDLSESECRLYDDLFDGKYSYLNIGELAKKYSDKKFVDGLFDYFRLNRTLGSALLTLVIIFTCVDSHMDRRESAFVRRLLENS